MPNILVTTDFSDKSKAALYFAIQLANQIDCTLTFIHVGHILTPTAWNIKRIESHIAEQTISIRQKLNLFVEKIYTSLQLPATDLNCIVRISVFPEAVIRQYAANNAFDFICISTRGAGKLERVFGTNTANLISKSSVPVIAVPYKYKPMTIKSIMYASDLEHFESEILNVVGFARPLGAAVELVHFKTASDSKDSLAAIEKDVRKTADYEMDFTVVNRGSENSIAGDIESAIKKSKPSMIIMFTDQSRNFFQKVFLSSKSEEYTFNAKIPLLAFSKPQLPVENMIASGSVPDVHTT